MDREKRAKKKGWAWRIRVLGSILSIGLLIILLYRQNWTEILVAVRNLSVGLILAVLFFQFLRYFWFTLRWNVLLKAQAIEMKYIQALRLVFAGVFASNFLPSVVGGDVIRIAGIFPRTEDRIAGAASVLVDRLVGMFAMLWFLPLSVPLLGGLEQSGSLVGAGLLGENRWITWGRKTFKQLISALKIWWKQPGSLFRALLASWLGSLSSMIGLLLLARGIGIDVNLWIVAGISAITYFITLIPISINGLGIRELTMFALYTQVGASPEQATSLALLFRILSTIVSLPGSLVVGEALPSNHGAEKNAGVEDLG
jgi:glycosyltransferase 2 family protein